MTTLEMNGGPASIESALVEELRHSLKNSTVLTPESEGYREAIRRWSDAMEMKAGVVVYVTSADDISTTILFCRAHNIEVAVSGGKHSSSGAASTNGGLVIDLSKMRQVTVNKEGNTVSVQGGAVWKDVDEAAGEHGLAAVGGTVNHTGVGGLTLGGGYGWLSGQYGLTVDNLLKVVMVLADGSIVKASEKENSDLFWAVRGAGQCFGVAVEFTFQAHEQKNPVWAGQMIFPAEETLDAIVNFANRVAEVSQGNSGMMIGLTAPPFLKGPAIITTVFYNGPTKEAEEFFGPLLRLAPIKNTVIERPYCTVNGMMNHAVDYGGRKLSKGACFVTPIKPDFVRSILGELQILHQEIPETKKSILLMEFFRSAKWCDVDKKAMAFANRGEHQNAMIGPFWNDPKHDKSCRLWARQVASKFVSELERVKEERGNPESMEGIGEYGNYDCLSATPHRIFGLNYERLTGIKARYDPENVFHRSYALLPELTHGAT